MAMVTRFEDLIAWQESRKLSQMVKKITNLDSFAKDYGLRDQIWRASISVMANIAEGFDCDSKIEFSRFLGIARRSAVEIQSLLYIAHDTSYISQAQFDEIYNQAQKTKAIIGRLKQSLTPKSS